jgi:ankyrin repeat protein
VIKLLYKYGAELNVKNKMGLTPVHVAAQADKAYSLIFLYTRGMDMESLDNELQTPLHWACY